MRLPISPSLLVLLHFINPLLCDALLIHVSSRHFTGEVTLVERDLCLTNGFLQPLTIYSMRAQPLPLSPGELSLTSVTISNTRLGVTLGSTADRLKELESATSSSSNKTSTNESASLARPILPPDVSPDEYLLPFQVIRRNWGDSITLQPSETSCLVVMRYQSPVQLARVLTGDSSELTMLKFLLHQQVLRVTTNITEF